MGSAGWRVEAHSAGYYRALAQKMLEQAKKAANEEARAGFLNLAASWHEMADKIESVEPKKQLS
jgi:hypothetical protein